MTPKPTTLSFPADRIFLGPKAEPLAYVRYHQRIDAEGYLPISLLEDCANHLAEEGYAHFSLPTGRFSHCSFIQRGFYSLIDDRGTYFLIEGTPCGKYWSIQVPSGRWIFSPSIARAA